MGSSRVNARFKPARRVWRRVYPFLPELNFLTIHYMYFLFTSLITGIIFWGSSTPEQSVRFIDSVFLTTSAMTEAGLNTVNLSTLNTWQQVMLFFLIMMGSAIFVSAFVVHVRRKAFEVRFKDEIEREMRISGRSSWFPLPRTITKGNRAQQDTNGATPFQGSVIPERHENDENAASDEATRMRRMASDYEKKAAFTGNGSSANESSGKTEDGNISDEPVSPLAGRPEENRITFAPQDRPTRVELPKSTGTDLQHASLWKRLITPRGIGARNIRTGPRLSISTTRRASMDAAASMSAARTATFDRKDTYVPNSGYLMRNSNFHDLTEADRRRLGGTEYKAVVFLSWLVPVYFILWQLISCIALGAYVNAYYYDTARQNGLNPWWVGAFNAVSAFNNSGMSLLDANMVAFNEAIYMLITMGLLILAGNTMYPIFLRLIVWAIKLVIPNGEDWADARITLQFLLDHPRRCYTNLFPSSHTWWLLFTVFLLNGIDCAFFVILNIGNSLITHFSPGIEFIQGLFQAFAVRAGGFYVVPIPNVRISLQVLYVVMMYISAFPVAITLRNSNVYEERSLGIFADDPGYVDMEKSKRGRFHYFKGLMGHGSTEMTGQFVQQQIRAQLAHDIWWLVLAVFLIMIIEGSSFEADPVTFSVFNVIFEVVSAYGTVGISVGLPDQAYSFCGAWHTLSKLILCAVMIRGRHRGLPVAIDKAVLLPREHDLEEQEDEQLRIERASTFQRLSNAEQMPV